MTIAPSCRVALIPGLAMADLGIMPIHFQCAISATRKGVSYVPRTDEYTLAILFRPLKAAP